MYKYLIVNLVFSPFGLWSGNFFLIAPFPDHCLLVPFSAVVGSYNHPWHLEERNNPRIALFPDSKLLMELHASSFESLRLEISKSGPDTGNMFAGTGGIRFYMNGVFLCSRMVSSVQVVAGRCSEKWFG